MNQINTKNATLLLAAIATQCLAQTPPPDPPAHFAAYGMAMRSGSPPTAWANLCTRTTASVYACVATDFANGSTSTRAGLETIFFRGGPISITAKADAGAATGVAGSAGASYGAGASLLYDLGKYGITHHPAFRNAFLVVSANWLKSDVTEFVVTPWTTISTRAFASKGVYRFGFGRTF